MRRTVLVPLVVLATSCAEAEGETARIGEWEYFKTSYSSQVHHLPVEGYAITSVDYEWVAISWADQNGKLKPTWIPASRLSGKFAVSCNQNNHIELGIHWGNKIDNLVVDMTVVNFQVRPFKEDYEAYNAAIYQVESKEEHDALMSEWFSKFSLIKFEDTMLNAEREGREPGYTLTRWIHAEPLIKKIRTAPTDLWLFLGELIKGESRKTIQFELGGFPEVVETVLDLCRARAK